MCTHKRVYCGSYLFNSENAFEYKVGWGKKQTKLNIESSQPVCRHPRFLEDAIRCLLVLLDSQDDRRAENVTQGRLENSLKIQSEDSAAIFFFSYISLPFRSSCSVSFVVQRLFPLSFLLFFLSISLLFFLGYLDRVINGLQIRIYPLTEPLNWAFISFIPASNGYEKDIRVSITLLSNVFAALSVHSCSNNTTTGGAAVPNWETWGEHPARTPCPLYRSLKTPDYCWGNERRKPT